MNRRVVLLVAQSELQRLLRDRKAVFLAVVLPVLLYPLLFWGSDELGRVSEERMEQQTASVAADLRGLDEDLTVALREAVGGLASVEWEERELDALEAALAASDAAEASADPASAPEAARESLLAAHEALEVDVALLGRAGESDDPRPSLVAVYRKADEAGNEGSDRVRDFARELGQSFQETRFEELFGGDPASRFDRVEFDIASATDAAGLALGKLLPLIAIVVLIGGGAFAALEAFAAEREVGTLETLLVQPVDRLDLAWGKFASVLVTASAAWLANTASFLACGAAGLLGEVDVGATSTGALVGRVALGSAVFFPTVMLAAAALSMVASRARSYREGQNYLLPLTLVGAALAAPVAAGDLELDALLALAPVLGPSLAMRDALAGSLAPFPAVLAGLSSLAYAAWAVRRVGGTLDAERLLQGADVDAEAAARRIVGRRATVWGLAGVGGVLLVGSWLQTQSLVWGLVGTLWVVALGLALAAARDLARRSGRTPGALLGARLPGFGSLIGSLLVGLGLAALMPHLFTLQQRFLPMPELDAEAFETLTIALLDQPLWLTLFLVALSPAICEELLFRGAVLGGLLRDTSALRAVATQALLFALAHGSVHRVLPTFLLGLALGAIRVRSGSLVPCVLLHAAYNGSLVLAAGGRGEAPTVDSSSTLVLSLGGLVGALLLWRARPPREA